MKDAHILVVDDELSMREFLGILLEKAGHRVSLAESAEAAFTIIGAQEFDLVITDLRMGGADGLEVVAFIKSRAPDTQVVVMTAFATTETAIEAMKRGAYDYVMKPFKVDEIHVVVDKALEKRALLRENISLKEELGERYAFSSIIGKSPAVNRVFDLVRRVAPTRTNVLLFGESGTGKELVARAIHYNSPRRNRPFTVVNCGAIPEALMESELFGHERGAFTGATAAKPGLFEVADGSTLLLDEIGELPLSLQVKLLRVLQERRVKRVGGVREKDVDVRIVAATNRRLEEEVREGRFREDLFYRLNVIKINLPTLAERQEDVPLLAHHFWGLYSEEMSKQITGFSKEAMAQIMNRSYTGNVRELANLVERAVTLTDAGAAIDAEVVTTDGLLRPSKAPKLDDLPPEGVDLEEAVGHLEKHLLLEALKRTRGIRKEAAKLLKISFRSIRYRLEKHGIDDAEIQRLGGLGQ